MNKERIAYLDVIRIVACAMVIMMHSPMPGCGAPGFVLTGISFVTAPCIGLFFMVSGALLLPASLSMEEFYKRRLSKVIFPTLIWTFIYLLVKIINGSITIDQLPSIVLSIPFSAQGDGILWFMYVLVGLYLITPIISSWLEKASKKEIVLILGLWGMSLLYPLLPYVVTINESHTGVLYYFSGYVGYYLFGYYLNHYKPRVGIIASLLMILLPIIACGLSIRLYQDLDFYRYFWYLSIFVVSMACGWFCLLSKINVRGGRLLTLASSLSFGIYLSHILVMRSFIWKICGYLSFWGSMQILLTVIMTFVLSFFLSFFLSMLSYGKYIVGYQINGER